MGKTRKNNNKTDAKKKDEEQQQQPQADKKEQQLPEKQQTISKPKKYLKKSIEDIKRIERSKNQRIFLLSAERHEDHWDFQVLGASGSRYFVETSTTVKCSCIDFRMKKKPCKHIFFIVTQVAQNEEILDYFKSASTKLSAAAYKVLDDQLTGRLRSRMSASKKDTKEIDLKDDTDCTICFTQMSIETEELQDCGTCKKYFHTICLNAWKNHNPTCPLCRSNFIIKGSANDPLGQLASIKIQKE